MDSATILLIFRGTERILIVSGAIVLLYLGYRSLEKTVRIHQIAEFSASGITVKLARIAPGVFFALLGAAILIYAVASSVTFTPEGGFDAASPTMSAATPLDAVRAINTAASALQESASTPGSQAEAAQAILILQVMKKEALVKIHGEDNVALHTKLVQAKNPEKILDEMTTKEKNAAAAVADTSMETLQKN